MFRLNIWISSRGRVLPSSYGPFGRNKSGKKKAAIVGKLFVVASSDDSCRIRGLMYDGYSALFRRLQYLEEKEHGRMFPWDGGRARFICAARSGRIHTGY